jgi:hypothetical protein
MPVYLYDPSDDGSETPADEDTYFCDKGRKAYPISEVQCHSFGPTLTNHWISHLEDGRRKATDSTKLFVESHGTALVGTRWSFSDKALWISDMPPNLSEGLSLWQRVA